MVQENEVLKNPFMPSFGRIPPMVLDQQTIMNNYIFHLNLGDAKYQTSLVYGVRGSGKTVFLLNVQRNYEKEKNHYFVRLNLGQGNLLFQLLSSLQQISGIDWKEVLKSIQGINLFGNGMSFKSVEDIGIINYSDVLKHILVKLKKRGISILVGIDEIEVSDDVRAFASVYQTLIGDDLDISLIMTGLPSRISDLQHEKTLTFLLRSNRIYLKPLDKTSVEDNFTMAFKRGNKTISPLVMKRLIEGVKGYAYAFQTIGYYAWEESKDDINNQVANEVIDLSKSDLYQNAYEKLYTEISSTDRKFLDIMAQYPSSIVPISYIVDELKKSKNYISVYRARLLDDQLIYAPERGYVSFTLPFFSDFIRWYKENHLI